MNIQFPFVGREKEMARLHQLHQQRRHVLLLGGAGVGKSTLIEQLRAPLDLCVCPHSEHLGEICKSLESALGVEASELHLVQRKNCLLQSLQEMQRPVVFDGASWTTPKLASFIESVSERAPVWLSVRSEHPWDVGRIWPLLVRFEHIELKPFHPQETQKMVAAAIQHQLVPEAASEIVDWLHHRSKGNLGMLCELLTEIARGHYDLKNPHSLRLLELDRRIHEMFPVGTETTKHAKQHDLF